MDLIFDLFAGTSLGDPPAQRLFDVAGATSRDMHLNEVQRLAGNIRPEFARRNHLVLPSQGYLVSLTEVPAQRGCRSLLNARLSSGNINPFGTLVKLPVIEQISIQLYGAGGWLFRDAVTVGGFSSFSAEIGATASVDVLNMLLPRVLNDALDSPAPVRLSFIFPFYAHSGLLQKNGFAYRWGIGVTL